MRDIQTYSGRVLAGKLRPDGCPIAMETIELLETYYSDPANTDLLSLCAVLADERPAAWLDTPSATTHHVFENLLDVLPVAHRPVPGCSGHLVTTTPERFALLPQADADRDAFDLQIGLFLGYPHDAVVSFITTDGPTTGQGDVLVRRGTLEPTDFAYTQFVPWVRPLSASNLERQIANGKAMAHRLFEVSTRCATDRIADLVAETYHEKRQNLEAKTPDAVLERGTDSDTPRIDDPVQLDVVGVRS